MPNWTLHQGECLDVLKTLPDNSVDSVVTDPPYGLSNHDAGDVREALRCWLDGKPYTPKGSGFMGKEWDAFVPGPEVWSECLRVLKPGGHLLVFAGTRTQDLMGIAVRLAGFDARDTVIVQGMLHWTYGSGFPKSLDVSKAIDKVNGEGGRTHKFVEWMRTTGLTARKIDEVLKQAGKISPTSTFAVHYFNFGQPAIPTKEMWEVVRPLCGDVPPWVDELVDRVEAEREVVGTKKSSLGGTVAAGNWDESFINQHRDLEYEITTPATDAAKQWKGWGTALKPTQEPVLVFRKPLDGTVADNVLKYGTGGINIDRCRLASQSGTGRWPTNTVFCHTPECVRVGTVKVKTGMATFKSTDTGSKQKSYSGGLKRQPHGEYGYANEDGTETVDRWECVDGCPVKALDEQSGELHARGNKTPTKGGGGMFDHSSILTDDHLREELKAGGGASRFYPQFTYEEDDNPFYYCAKASRSERDGGCEDLPKKRGPVMSGVCQNCGKGQLDGRREGPCCDDPDYTSDAASGNVSNHHPTVKPIALMRWLARLVTPTNGVVLDPFNGSGTTGCAAVLEGFQYIGIEREPEYVEIARARIAHHERVVQGGVKNPWTENPTVEATETTPLTLDDLFGF